MNRQHFLAQRDYLNMVHGVTVRAIGTLGDDELGFQPRPEMRTPRQLIFHIYAQEKLLAEAVQSGRMTTEALNGSNPEDAAVASQLAALRTIADVRAFAESCHQTAETIARALSEEDLNRPVESPMGAYPAWRWLAFAYDEHWHHRGQLYTYLRLLGKEPPMLYDY
jgi:uncharacterized damage-inducible protein DinB